MTTIACGPYVCPYPDPAQHRPAEQWTCPNCGTRYWLTWPKPERWWRDWYALDGRWLALPRWLGWLDRRTA